MDRIKLGRITAPVGIKGEIRVYPYLEQARFSDIDKICVEDGEPCRVEKIRADKNMLVLKLSVCGDRNTAETLRNKELYLPEGDELDLGEDTYYVDKLVGLKLVTEGGEEVGTLREVISRPAQDLYEVEKPNGSGFLLPAVKEFILKVDTEAGIMTVRIPKGLTDL